MQSWHNAKYANDTGYGAFLKQLFSGLQASLSTSSPSAWGRVWLKSTVRWAPHAVTNCAFAGESNGMSGPNWWWKWAWKWIDLVQLINCQLCFMGRLIPRRIPSISTKRDFSDIIRELGMSYNFTVISNARIIVYFSWLPGEGLRPPGRSLLSAPDWISTTCCHSPAVC